MSLVDARPPLVAASFLALVGGALPGNYGDSPRWARVLEEARETEARLARTRVRREALWGDTTDGLAGLHYDRALGSPGSWDPDAQARARLAEGDEGRRLRARLVAEGEERLAELHLAAHAGDVTRHVEGHAPERKLSSVRCLANLAELQATLLLEEGRDLEAVGVLLDRLQLAGDLLQAPLNSMEELIGDAVLWSPLLSRMIEDGSVHSLSPEAGRRLAEGVAELDSRLEWRPKGLDGEFVGVVNFFDTLIGDHRAAREARAEHRMPAADVLPVATGYAEVSTAFRADLQRAFPQGPSAVLETLDRWEPWDGGGRSPFQVHFDFNCSARLKAIARFRLIALALAPEYRPRDPWVAQCLREEEAEKGVRMWLDHDAFEGVELLVAR